MNYSQISANSFSSSAEIHSYACRTGMGNLPDLAIEEAIRCFPQTNESLAQLLADHLRIMVKAFIRRSDYKNTGGSFEAQRMVWVWVQLRVQPLPLRRDETVSPSDDARQPPRYHADLIHRPRLSACRKHWL
jgi:hypothetical protein